MRPEPQNALGFGLLAVVIFVLPAIFHEPLMAILGFPTITPLLVLMSLLMVGLVMIYAHGCFRKNKETEENLEAKYRLIFEKLPHSMWVLSGKDLSILTANEQAVREYGEITENGNPRMFFSLFQRPEQLKFQDMTQPHVIKNLIMIDTRYDPRNVDLFSMPFIYNGEESVMVLVVDYSDIQRALWENIRLNDSLKIQNQRLRDFSFAHSHHIRSHLANILGILDLNGDQEHVDTDVLGLLKRSAENLDKEVRKVN
jgi:hypothetical protein